MNKKGFTLVELLAVIVILAVIILVAINAVLPQMERARKNAFADEVMNYAKAAETKYVSDSQEEDNVGDITSGICYNLKTPNYGLHGEYVSKNDDSYTGVVILKQNPTNTSLYDKYVFIASNKYYYNSNNQSDGTLENPVKKLTRKQIKDGNSTNIKYQDCCAYKKALNSAYECVASDYQSGQLP
jgi:prepilin-type N-terminal cleavage/methylation domain-containing protein